MMHKLSSETAGVLQQDRQRCCLRLHHVMQCDYKQKKSTGNAAELELVPNPSTIAWEKPFRAAQGLCLVQPQRTAGSTSPPCRASPSRTVATHSPRAPRVLPKLHALQMLAAIREAIPIGEVQRTAVTILPITKLKTCITKQLCKHHSHTGFKQEHGALPCMSANLQHANTMLHPLLLHAICSMQG